MADGLLEEVNSILGSRLAIKAADEAHFGGKQVYTNISPSTSTASDPLQKAIEKAKSIAQGALGGAPSDSSKVAAEVAALREELREIKSSVAKLLTLVEKLTLSGGAAGGQSKEAIIVKAPAAASEKAEEDFDLFGSEEESDDEEKKKVVEERLKAYHDKKSKKPGVIAKSSVILDVKPWDDETDLKKMEELVRGIEMDGLVWGGGKLVPVGYGINKLQIICVIEDDKVSVEDLNETITGFEDYVQSVDIVAFNKI